MTGIVNLARFSPLHLLPIDFRFRSNGAHGLSESLGEGRDGHTDRRTDRETETERQREDTDREGGQGKGEGGGEGQRRERERDKGRAGKEGGIEEREEGGVEREGEKEKSNSIVV